MNDFYADSILAEILKADLEWTKTATSSTHSSTATGKNRPPHLSFRDALVATLCDMFAECSVVDEPVNAKTADSDEHVDDTRLTIRMDNKSVSIDLSQLSVSCEEDKQLEQSVATVLKQVNNLY